MPLSATHRPGARSITVEHVNDAQHVVHGVYGLVLVSGRTFAHLALTWSAARPFTVAFTCTAVATGGQEWLYVDRELLKSGGKLNALKVDFAGDKAFVEVSGADRVSWIAINRRWLADFIAATEDATAPPQPTASSPG